MLKVCFVTRGESSWMLRTEAKQQQGRYWWGSVISVMFWRIGGRASCCAQVGLPLVCAPMNPVILMTKAINTFKLGRCCSSEQRDHTHMELGFSPVSADTSAGHSRTCASYTKAWATSQRAAGTKHCSPGIIRVRRSGKCWLRGAG